ncbi:hypothetical protein H0H81_005283 [Sphagnurus paluster]|uniref:Calpain catalytic domain-containing protein n=1 Tax=Sphagnurus paluster TaxID=117069 RepID=A0A9P7FSB6_9AGAR|nr:hypothetical protein H0H81_005283 [Sphagnurus paluster]
MVKSKNRKGRQVPPSVKTTPEQPPPVRASFPQKPKQGGLLVTDELEKALEECKLRVSQISKDCRRRNRKFRSVMSSVYALKTPSSRDIEFDLETDRERCLNGLESTDPNGPSDVLRATQIFDNPSFFIDGAEANDLVQGGLGDCWFVSALATITSSKGLIEKFCVARDEQVGVYGFIFFRDTAWVIVIVDDLLFTSIPRFEELSRREKQLYHNSKETYNKAARKTGKSLYFARSGTNGETWVPLIEKAYAKLHGSYATLNGGQAGEAIEDLTGGVTSFIYTKDVLDPDRFWNEELLLANTDRLFGCSFNNLDSSRSGEEGATVNGLIGAHAYSILRAVEAQGKRFVVIRNPWGESEWTGAWSDGSKEWTPEWLSVLPELGHAFGNDGQFVMEYKDFLENWDRVDRTLLFDSSWTMSSIWLKVPARPLPSAWGYGDISFTISVPATTSSIIVLSQLDDRKGETSPVTTSSTSPFGSRSVNAEIELEGGDYVVHVRLDRVIYRPENYVEAGLESWSDRIYARVLTEKMTSQSIACNFDMKNGSKYLPVPLSNIAGRDLSEITADGTIAALTFGLESPKLADDATASIDSGSPVAQPALSRKEEISGKEEAVGKDEPEPELSGKEEADPITQQTCEDQEDGDAKPESDTEGGGSESGNSDDSDDGPRTSDPAEGDIIFLGLRVYTNKESPVTLGGQVRATS